MKNIYEINGCDIPKTQTELQLDKLSKKFKIYRFVCNIGFVLAITIALIPVIIFFLTKDLNKVLMLDALIALFIFFSLKTYLDNTEQKRRDEIIETEIQNRMSNVY